MAKQNKKLLGIIYPICIFVYIAVIYYCIIVNLYFMNKPMMFGSTSIKIISITYLIFFHILLALILYCYITVMLKNPGEPPQFWVS